MSVIEIINRVTEANYKYYTEHKFNDTDIIDSLIIHICQKHAKNFDDQYNWNEYPELLVTDICDFNIDLILDGIYNVNNIHDIIGICSDCVNNLSEFEQKMDKALKERFIWFKEIPCNCNNSKNKFISDIKKLITLEYAYNHGIACRDDDEDYSIKVIEEEEEIGFDKLFDKLAFENNLIKLLEKYENSKIE